MIEAGRHTDAARKALGTLHAIRNHGTNHTPMKTTQSVIIHTIHILNPVLKAAFQVNLGYTAHIQFSGQMTLVFTPTHTKNSVKTRRELKIQIPTRKKSSTGL